jgi:hypothetical protein
MGKLIGQITGKQGSTKLDPKYGLTSDVEDVYM